MASQSLTKIQLCLFHMSVVTLDKHFESIVFFVCFIYISGKLIVKPKMNKSWALDDTKEHLWESIKA